MFNIGPQELLLVLIVALIIVGPKRLPELGRTIGRGLNEFRKIQDEVKDMVKFDLGGDHTDADEPETAPSFDEHHDGHPQDAEDDEVDAAEEPADDMTHSERVVAAMADQDDDLDQGEDPGEDDPVIEPPAVLEPPDVDTEPETESDAPPAAAAE